jgi:hypothetical protein
MCGTVLTLSTILHTAPDDVTRNTDLRHRRADHNFGVAGQKTRPNREKSATIGCAKKLDNDRCP